MKQYVTTEQYLTDLTPHGVHNLGVFLEMKPEYQDDPCYFPHLSIGKMIEYLGEHWTDKHMELNSKYREDGKYFAVKNNDLCDVLWQDCVEVLND